MSEREKFLRRNLIIKRLRKKESTFDEIANYLELQSEIQSFNFNVSLRTFQRDVQDIFSIFDIEIKYDKSRKVYYILQDQNNDTNERLFEAIDIFNALHLTEQISQNILFEKQKPKGTENLYGILHAIKSKVLISFTHQKYWDDESTIRSVEPYAIKEFKNRWYVLAKDLKDDSIKTFGLDRISDLDITKIKFEITDDLDIIDYFKHSFGVIKDIDNGVEEIILSFNPFQGKYIKSLPLHESQKILIDNENECKISLQMYVTHDFVMEVLSLGNNVKVISPQNLIDVIKKSYTNALKQYK